MIIEIIEKNMNNENSIIKKNVMRRVYFIHTARKFLQPRILKLGLLALFLAIQGWLVSIPNVVSNFGNSVRSLESLYSFVVSAFLNTQVSVQLLSIGIVIAGVLSVFDFVRKSRGVEQQLSWN